MSEKKHLSGPVNGDLRYQETEVNRNSLQRTGNAMESTELVVTFSKDRDQGTEEMPW